MNRCDRVLRRLRLLLRVLFCVMVIKRGRNVLGRILHLALLVMNMRNRMNLILFTLIICALVILRVVRFLILTLHVMCRVGRVIRRPIVRLRLPVCLLRRLLLIGGLCLCLYVLCCLPLLPCVDLLCM